MENKSLYRILRIIFYLSGEHGYTVAQLASKFDTSTKTIYRNIDMLKDAGFFIEKDKNKRLVLKKYNASVFSDKLLSFSLEETALIKDALLATHSQHPLKNITLSKLFALSDLDNIVDIFYDQHLAANIGQVCKAIKNKQQVILKNYRSSNSNSISDRKVEPVSFHQNMKYFFAFEVATKKVKQFKPERAESVEIMNHEFKFQHLHASLEPDVFGVNAKPVFQVVLKLNIRAVNLLREEFPASVRFISETNHKDVFIFSAFCKGFEGVGRFVLGLMGDVKVIENKEFKQYLSQKIKVFQNSDKIFSLDNI